MPREDSNRIRVLLIEDDDDDVVLISGLLSDVSSAGYELTRAADYDTALLKLDAGDFDVCLLDYRLGNKSGLDLLHGTLTDELKAPVIILTGQGDYETDLEAMRSGAADYLVKGQINEHILERTIRYSIERKKAEEALRDSQKQLEFLSAQLIEVQEKERLKVAAELHDSLGQILSAIKFRIENILIREYAAGSAASDLDAVIPMIQTGIEQVRSIYTYLRPTVLDDLGILAAIGWFCREFEQENQGITVEKNLDVAEEDVPEGLKLVLFRIIQEALNNVATHSCAGIAELGLKKGEGNLELTIRDNGEGFDAPGLLSSSRYRGLGLISMQKRAELSGGLLSVESAPGAGTTVRAIWPAGD
jgi:signal transduction histidine kinase